MVLEVILTITNVLILISNFAIIGFSKDRINNNN